MSLPTGVPLTATFKFYKAGVLADPSPLPTAVTGSTYPDATAGPTPALTHAATGVFTVPLGVFTALLATQIGTYDAYVYSSDTTLDSQYAAVEWVDVGINSVSALSSTGVTQTAQAVLNATAANYDTSGTIGEKINTGGSVGDPLENSPSDYIDGQIGYLIGTTNTNASRIGSAGLSLNAPRIDMPGEALIIGRSYKQNYGNAITFTVSNLDVDLTDPDVTTEWRFKVGSSDVVFDGTADTATTGHIDIDATETDGVLSPGSPNTEFVVLVDGDPIHIVKGQKQVQDGVNS